MYMDCFFCFKQKTAYELRISDWSSDVCSSDLATALSLFETATHGPHAYFDGVVMLLFFLLCGRWLDSVMRDRARGGVTALLRNMGTGAMVVDADEASRWVDEIGRAHV